jgi:predicted nucleic acid-binding protein
VLLLDSTVLVDALRGRAAAKRIRRLRDCGETLFVCAVNVDEVFRGLLSAEEDDARRLIRGTRLARLGKAQGEQAGRWRQDFARRGQTLSQADCLIAAAALAIGGRLATGNPRHFPMPELTVEHWPVSA